MKLLLTGGLVIIVVAYLFTNKPLDRNSLFKYPDNYTWGNAPLSTAVLPFKIHIEKSILDDLQNRLKNWRKHSPMPNTNDSYGFVGEKLDKLILYWKSTYDWKKQENALNQFPQFTTNIQGLKIHFVHAKGAGKARRRIPVLLLHGWPGSFVEFNRAIPILLQSDKEGLAFDIVAPSIPGYGFSDSPNRPGFNPIAAAQVFKILMTRLGYDKFIIQGGDWGSIIGGVLSRMYPESIIGYHSNFATPPLETFIETMHFMAALNFPKVFVDKNDIPKLEKVTLTNILEESGYSHIQATKPDTIGVALTDSPVGLCAWIVEKFINYTDKAEFKGDHVDSGLSNDNLLTNVMIYWTSNHAASSLRLYKYGFQVSLMMSFNFIYLLNREAAQTKSDLDKWMSLPLQIPTGVTCYPKEGLCCPKALLVVVHKKLVHYEDAEKGGHFAAFEQPETYATDFRKAARAFLELETKVKSKTDKQEDKIKKHEAGKLNMQQPKQQSVTEKKKMEAIESSLQGSKPKPKKSNDGATKLPGKGNTSQKRSKAEQKQ